MGYSKCKPVKDKVFYDEYALERPWCEACGVSASRAPYHHHCGGVGLSRHHLVKFRRSDEATNLLVLCNRDHQLAEGILLRDPSTGLLLPKLTLGMCLSIKKARSPELLDLDRLAELYGQALPDFEPIPEFIEREWAMSGRGYSRLSGKMGVAF